MLTENFTKKNTVARISSYSVQTPHLLTCGCQLKGSEFLKLVEEFAALTSALAPSDWKIPVCLVQPFHWTCGAQGFQRHIVDAQKTGRTDGITESIWAAAREHSRQQLEHAEVKKDLSGEPGTIDTIIVNGKIFTSGLDMPWCEALAIHAGVVVASGSNESVRALATVNTEILDVGGRTVIPGFNDAHMHHTPDPSGIRLPVDPIANPSFDDIRPLITEAVAASPAGTWIYSIMGEQLINDKLLNRLTLDEISPEHPVIFLGMTNHTNVVNTAAMRRLGIAEEEADPVGGTFERLPGSYKISGRINEYAQWSPQRCFASMATIEEGVSSLRNLSDECVRWGITTLQNMSWTPAERYVEMVKSADLPIKVRVIRFPPSGPEGRILSEGRNLKRTVSNRIEVHGTKWILDGTPVEGAAAIGRPYSKNSSDSGRENFIASDVSEMLRESLAADEQLLLHAIGTTALESVLNAVETLKPAVDWKAKHLRVEHADGLTKSQVERIKNAGVMVVQNPTHFWFYINNEVYNVFEGPFQSLEDSGIDVAIGSDGPLNPFLSLMAAVTHPARPHEAMSMESAVRAYTHGSAISEGKGESKGRLTSGYAADLAVLSQDIFSIDVDQLPGTQSVLTLVDGKVVYRDTSFHR